MALELRNSGEPFGFRIALPFVAHSLPFPPRSLVMKKVFALLITITILAAVAAPGFAQGRSSRTSCALYTYKLRNRRYRY